MTDFLKKGTIKDKQNAQGTYRGWPPMGMINSSSVKLTSLGAEVCLESDNELGPLNFLLKRTLDGGYLIQHVAATPNDAGCAQGTFLPEARQGSAATPPGESE